MPPGKPWANLRAQATCELAYLLLVNEPKGIPEARELLAAINMEDAPRNTKIYYESLLKRLEGAETPNE
jgi:hypothetical protein